MRLRGGGQKEDLLRLVTCNRPLFIRLRGLQPALHILLHGLQPALPILRCSINLRCVFTLGQPNKEYDGFVLYSKFLILEPRLVTFQPLDIDLMLTHDSPTL